MKTYILISLLLIGCVLISCNEDVSLKSDFKEEYILNCILSMDTNYQVAYLSKSFQPEGYDPSEYTGDPFIKNAQIAINEGNNIYVFREGVVDSLPGFNFTHPITIYYLDNYTPQFGNEITINAVIPGGGQISATQTTVPQKFNYLPVIKAPIPPSDSSSYEIEFRLHNNIQDVYFVPKLDILYKHSPDSQIKRVQIPYEYVPGAQGLIPVYPAISELVDFLYDRRIMNITMRKISEGDDYKPAYQMKNAELTMLFVNDDLAAFYSGSNYVSDNYSIVVTMPDYSNVSGGKGIFGSYSSISGYITLERSYVESFGYTYR